MPGDPADIRRAPPDVAGAVIKAEFVRQARPEQIAAGGVEHALGLAGAARGVEDEQRVFRAHHFGLGRRRRRWPRFMIPDIAARAAC